jgi:helix-turn-helix protein
MVRMGEIAKRAFGFREVGTMFGVSRDSIKRLWKSGDLATITVGGRRLVPLSEVERIERQGIGTPRKRKAK